MKQPIKKKEFKKPNISELKAKLGLGATKTNLSMSSANKPIDFFVMPEAFTEATKLPGIPLGITSIIYGHSNTGKSLLKNCLIASAQRKNVLPVIIETENNFSFQFAMDCGVNATPVYDDVEVEHVNEETGEITTSVEKQIIDYDGEFLFYDSEILVQKYGDYDHAKGQRTSKRRKYPVIEDVAMLMNDLLDAQENGDIQQPLLFIWDSVGSIPSYASLMSNKSNSMWDAKAMQESFNILLNTRIASSTKISAPYTNTFVAINKVWLDSMSSPMSAPSLALKGGQALTFAARLSILVGGTIKASTKKLTATSKGAEYTYGQITKIKVIKNQLDSPYNLTYSGSFCCVPDGMISESKLDEYKKKNISKILKQLQAQIEEVGGNAKSIKEEDIVFTEEDNEE